MNCRIGLVSCITLRMRIKKTTTRNDLHRQKHEFAVILVLDIDDAPANHATTTHLSSMIMLLSEPTTAKGMISLDVVRV